MFKVFLGSTFKDLHEHRKAVQAAINRRDDCKAVVMEEFGARAGRPKDVCLEIVGGCDLYVGLIGHCYGHVQDGESVSITEAEYDAAVQKGLPRLLFLANERFTPPVHIREIDEQYRKLQDFRERLKEAETVQEFDNDKGSLAAYAGEALSRELRKLQARAEQPAGSIFSRTPSGEEELRRASEQSARLAKDRQTLVPLKEAATQAYEQTRYADIIKDATSPAFKLRLQANAILRDAQEGRLVIWGCPAPSRIAEPMSPDLFQGQLSLSADLDIIYDRPRRQGGEPTYTDLSVSKGDLASHIAKWKDTKSNYENLAKQR